MVHLRDDRPEFVHSGRMRDRFAGVLGVAGKTKGLRAVEGDGESLFPRRLSVRANECGLFGGFSLGVLASSFCCAEVSVNQQQV